MKNKTSRAFSARWTAAMAEYDAAASAEEIRDCQRAITALEIEMYDRLPALSEIVHAWNRSRTDRRTRLECITDWFAAQEVSA